MRVSLLAFLRISTNPRLFERPASIEQSLAEPAPGLTFGSERKKGFPGGKPFLFWLEFGV